MSQFPTQPTSNAPIQQQSIPRPRSPEPMTEVLEAMRSEFLSVTNEINNLKSTKEELETKISIQKSEIENFKNQAKVLEGCFLNMRKRYEQEINQLRKELETGEPLNRKIPQNSSLNPNNSISVKQNNGGNNGNTSAPPPPINNNRSSAQPPQHNTEHTPTPGPAQQPAPVSPVNTDPHQEWRFVPHRNLEKYQFDLINSLNLPSVVCCVQFNPTGNLLAIGLNQAIQIFQIKAGPDGSYQVNRLITLSDGAGSGRVQYVRSLAFSPDSKQLASGGEDFVVTLWDLRDLPTSPVKDSDPSPIQPPIKLNGHEGDIYTLSFHPTQPLLISGSGDCTCRVWDLNRNNECKFVFRTDSPSPQASPKDPSITCLKIFGNKLATGSLDGKLRVWDLNSGKMLELFEAHNDGIYGVGWINQGRGLLSASLDNTLKQWTLQSGSNTQHADLNGLNNSSSTQCVATFKGHEDFVLCFDINYDEKLIVSGGKDQSLCLWNLERRELIGRLVGHRNSVISVSFHPSKNIIVSGSGDSTCKLWIFKPSP